MLSQGVSNVCFHTLIMYRMAQRQKAHIASPYTMWSQTHLALNRDVPHFSLTFASTRWQHGYKVSMTFENSRSVPIPPI